MLACMFHVLGFLLFFFGSGFHHFHTSKLQKKAVAIINKATTLRRHQQANHPVEYWKWVADNSFLSMLPKDA